MIEYPSDVTLVEMLPPRDGFQRLDEFVPTDEKVEIIDALSETGVDEIEITSFTHPKAVPTLRDADEVAQRIERHDDVTYRALVPNAVGMERAIDAGVDKGQRLGDRERDVQRAQPEHDGRGDPDGGRRDRRDGRGNGHRGRGRDGHELLLSVRGADSPWKTRCRSSTVSSTPASTRW